MTDIKGMTRRELVELRDHIEHSLLKPEQLEEDMRARETDDGFAGNRLAWLLNKYGEQVAGVNWMPYDAYGDLPDDEADELKILLGGEPDGAYVVDDGDGLYRASLYEMTVHGEGRIGFGSYEDAITALLDDIRMLKMHPMYANGVVPVWFVSNIPGNEARFKIMEV